MFLTHLSASRKLLSLILVLYTSIFIQAQEVKKISNPKSAFILKGIINNATVPYLYLQYTTPDNHRILDSSKIVEGKFQFTGFVSEPTWALLKANTKPLPDEINRNISPIYIEKGNLSVSVSYNDFKNIRVTGSKTQNDKTLYDALIAPYIKKYSELRRTIDAAESKKLSKPQMDSLNNLATLAVKGIQSTAYKYILMHPNSYISVHELATYNNRWPTDTIKALFGKLSRGVKKTRDGQEIAKTLAAIDSAAIGTTARDFEGIGTKGLKIKLSDFKGKFVLLDFWGSWCQPCRDGNAHLIELFNSYKERDFEIIAISCFDQTDPWKKAIRKDGTDIWKNIMDIDGKPGRPVTIAHRYAVYSFPTKILIDKSGKIIGRFNGNQSDLLDKVLAENLLAK